MTPANAEIIALKGLGFLANSGAPMDRFLAITGTDPGELRHRAEEPEFLAAVMDFFLSDEVLLTNFCEDASIDPQDIQIARQALPGV
ncbi:MAG TPA: DUF3572 domain-containing protein [Rhizomicrobium sp.]